MDNTRIIVVNVDDDLLTFELEKPDDIDEDTFYSMACNYVLSNIQIEVQ